MRKNHRSCHVVADFFLLQNEGGAGDSITNLKLQKLCYYAQGWSLALLGQAIFDERIKAWAHGPAIPDLYHRFKERGYHSIDPLSLRTEPYEELNDDEIALLTDVWARYGTFSGKQLELMTHNESPWREAYGDTPPGEKCNNEITLAAMRDFFSGILNAQNEPDSRAKGSAAS